MLDIVLRPVHIEDCEHVVVACSYDRGLGFFPTSLPALVVHVSKAMVERRK